MSTPAIKLDGLTKDYAVGFWRPRPYRALDQVSLEVASGEVLGYLGPNGAGKTTTLKLLMQLIYPTAGTAEILGRPAGDVGARRRLGYLPELPYFYDNLSAEELLVYFGGLFSLSAADARRRAATLLDRVGLGAARHQRLRRYSKGMLQRVGIAQALVNDPEVVFLDEPMSGLDPVGRRDTRELIRQLGAEGRTVFFSSHILSDAEALCDRVAIMAQGKLIATGRIADLAFEVLGWEVVVSGGSLDGMRALGFDEAAREVDGRLVIELTIDQPPERVLPELARQGAQVVALTPRHESLEDYFMRMVSQPGDAD
ncbi:MAG: ABC transporter [Acidobacteria bacterium]|nr:ABC transporter [Acidobacteriota bacterium]